MALNPRIGGWQGKRVWLVGASTGIGRATASALHALGAQVIVSARESEALRTFAATHAGSLVVPLDVTRREDVATAAATLLSQGPLDLVCYCAGHYRELRATEFDLDEMLRHQQVNVTGALNVLAAILPAMLEAARRGPAGHISLVSSVAGFRGLPRGLAYGPTKAALTHIAESLYLDLCAEGIGVSVIHPGFVATPLTAQNDFSMPALITPETAAAEILRGWEHGAFEIHFPKRFTRVMKLLRLLPYALYFPAVRRMTGG
jgi:NAD(P)-dependent dehydrogenase (short-subunit alcohol dehydrogenase family)